MRIQTQREAFAFRLGMSDDRYAQKAHHVDRVLSDLKHKQVDTRSPEFGLGAVAANGRTHWSRERRAQHQAVIRHFYDKMMEENAPREGKGIIMGGLGGAGKGFAQDQPHIPLDKHQYFTINPDDIKEHMAANGMLPKVDHLSPMEASGVAHEEASELAKRIALLAYRQKRNLNWDITMSSPGSVASRIQKMRKHGYGQVDGAFVDADPKTARQRVENRHREGEENLLEQGRGNGGRWVPQEMTKANLPTPGSGKLSKNAEVFDQLRPMFDNTLDIDSSHNGPPVVRNQSGIRWKDGGFPAWQPSGGPQSLMAARRLYAWAERRASGGDGLSVKDLIDRYRDGGLGYSELVDELAAFDYSDPHIDDRPDNWPETYDRAETEPDDNSFFWVEAAVDDGTLSTGQVEEIVDAIDAHHSRQGDEDFVHDGDTQADDSDDDDYGDE